MYKHSELTSAIINAFYDVYNTLGYGFLEKVYENTPVYELRKRGFMVNQQSALNVYYDGLIVGQYFADLLVEDAVVVEIKAAEGIAEEHEAQLLNYLRASNLDRGLLLNFGSKPQIKRKIYETARKD